MAPMKYNDQRMKDSYQLMQIGNVVGLVTPYRIERESIPEGLYAYGLREAEDDEERFIGSINHYVMVNHMGDFIANEPVLLKNDGETYFDDIYDYDYIDATKEEIREQMVLMNIL